MANGDASDRKDCGVIGEEVKCIENEDQALINFLFGS